MFSIGDITGLRPSCSSGKTPYKSMRAAEVAIAARRRSAKCIDGDTLGAYRCAECGDYHFGHSKYRARGNDGEVKVSEANAQASGAQAHKEEARVEA